MSSWTELMYDPVVSVPSVDDEQVARRVVAAHARDVDDCRSLLGTLGLLGEGHGKEPVPEFCSKGHLRTPENTRYREKHGRTCLTCDRARKHRKTGP